MTAAATRVPREIFCITDGLCRSLATARNVSQGRFTQIGATLDIASPDWRNTAIHPDREWWIEWSKFYFGLDLAHAYCSEGDERYVRTWQALVSSWIDQVPVELGPSDALARRLQNWVYAWLRFTRSGSFRGFEADFEERLVSTIATHAAYLASHLAAERNHRTLELYTLFTTALALPETDPDGTRLAFAWSELQRNLVTDCRPDGVQREHSTHYHMVALRSWLGARENARRFGLPVAPGYDDRLARACEFAMHCQRPDGSIPMLGDADTGDYRDLLTFAADLLDRPDFAFVASNGLRGVAPMVDTAAFEDAGYYVQRSPWRHLATSERPRHLIFDCGPLGDGGHGHYDVLSIDVWAGEPVVVDPGRFTYDEGTPNWRRWFKGTAAHNTVSIDACDQTAYRGGKPKTPPATGRRLGRHHQPGLAVFAGEAYSPEYDAVHRRHVCFVDHDYWVIVDRLDAATPHDYDLRFNLGASAWQRTTVEGHRVSTPGLQLLLAGDGTLGVEPGWVSPRYGVKTEAPVLSFKLRQRTRAWFVSALLPRDVQREPGLELGVSAAADGSLRIDVPGVVTGHDDLLVVPVEGSSFDWRREAAEPRERGRC